MSASASPMIPGRFVHGGVLALTVSVFAVVVASVTLPPRAGLQEQILQQQAEKLAEVASMHLENTAADLGDIPLSEVPATLPLAVLKTSKLHGVRSVRVFDAARNLRDAWPVVWSDAPPTPQDWARLAAGESFARLHGNLSTEDVVGFGPAERGLIEAWVPLRRAGASTLVGVAQFWVASGAMASEVAAHDRRLRVQALVAWTAGSVVIVLALGWAFRRLDTANRALRTRSEDLQRANRELVLAAKTSALGAVTAHLMHELKNPLAGLELIVAGQEEAAGGGATGGELGAASELTRRLRTMVNDVVGVLRDEQSSAEFELTCADIAEIAQAKVQAVAAERGVALGTEASASVSISGRRANLAGLVLRNLLQNAIEATGVGGTVRLTGGAAADGGTEFCVTDEGGGLPEAVRARLFQPCPSSKVGGSGLGLALSQQLAQHAGGRLELMRSDQRGTSFRLVLAPEA